MIFLRRWFYVAEADSVYLKRKDAFRRIALIDGNIVYVDVPSIVGFCHNQQHKGFLTVTILNKHDCIEKNCHYLEKFEDYPFWISYYRKKRAEEIKKTKLKHKKEQAKLREDKLRRKEDSYKVQAYMFAEKYGITNFEITSIRQTQNVFTIFYVSNKAFNDWFDFREIAFAMSRNYRKKFVLKHVKTPDGHYAVTAKYNKKHDGVF